VGTENIKDNGQSAPSFGAERRNSPEYEVEQVALQVLWEMASSNDSNQFPGRIQDLARKISDVIDAEDLIIEGKDSDELFSIGRFDTGCYESGFLFIGTGLEEALNSRPDSARAELLHVASEAALTSGKRSVVDVIGGIKNVEDVIADWLLDLPLDTPVTPEQFRLMADRD